MSLVDEVRAVFEAQAAGDLGPARALMRDDAIIHVPGFIPLKGLAGVDGIVALAVELLTMPDGNFRSDFLDAVGAGRIVATTNRVTASRAANTITYSTVWVFRFGVDEDRIEEAWLHPSIPEGDVARFYGFGSAQ